MINLLDIVKERLIAEYPSSEASCPFCQSKHLTQHEHWYTLVGGGDGTLDGDPNHHHWLYVCDDCKECFYRESSSGVVWYTHPTNLKILNGLPNCFENYVYTCVKCNGNIRRVNTDMDGVNEVLWLSYSEKGKEFRTFWDCVNCGRLGETDYQYYRTNRRKLDKI